MNMEELCDVPVQRWFAVRVKSNREQVVASIAQNKDFKAFVPLYHCRRRWSDRFKSVELPLFPGYVFCQLDPDQRFPILTIPGVLHFVGIGKMPIPVDDSEIEAIQTAIRSGFWAEPWPFLKMGQRVRLEHGPLSGVEGFLVEAHKKNRIVVSITLLQRSIAVELERDWVTPLDAGGRAVTSPAKAALPTRRHRKMRNTGFAAVPLDGQVPSVLADQLAL
jgi:transcription antitermination factor NusG